MDSLAVMPAIAGIQEVIECRWIPAFAGMPKKKQGSLCPSVNIN